MCIRDRNVPFKTIFNSIIETNNLSWYSSNNIIVVTNTESLGNTKSGLETEVVHLDYIESSVAITSFKDQLSLRGDIKELDITGGKGSGGTNKLIITDTRERINYIKNLIQSVDKRPTQVNIAVKFIETTLKKDETLGINWAVRVDTSLALGLGQLINNSGKQVSLATLAPSTVSALLQVLASDAETRLLQEPQVTTFNNSPATITVGTTIPVLVPQAEGSMFGSQPYTYQDQNVNVNLNVLPRINDNNFITMSIQASVQAITGYVGAERRPIVSSRATDTNVMVRDGETLMIGGLIFDQDDSTIDKLPYLGDLPFFGRFFKSDGKSKSQNELLIFITPTIIES